MGIHDYHFVTRWLVPGTPREVSDVLSDAAELPRWWPSVYLEAEELSKGGDGRVGRSVRLLTRGWLPYTLAWNLTITESRDPLGFSFEAEGDFEGRGEWKFEPAGAWVGVSFDWSIEARKPLLRLLAPFFRPVLEANHRWAMRRGEESLRLELERRRAASEWERERVGAPPGPAERSGWILLGLGASALALLAAAGGAARRRRRRRGWRRLFARG
jgi:hypothetical protein